MVFLRTAIFAVRFHVNATESGTPFGVFCGGASPLRWGVLPFTLRLNFLGRSINFTKIKTETEYINEVFGQGGTVRRRNLHHGKSAT